MRPNEEERYHKPKCKICGENNNSYSKPSPNVNCEAVIEEYHKVMKEVDEMFKQSDELIYKEAFEYLWNALKALESSMEIVGKALEEQNNANNLIDKSGCYSKCNKNSRRCRELKKESEKIYELEVKKIMSAMRLIEKAIFEIKDAEVYSKKSYMIDDEYKKCVHESKHEKPCHKEKENLYKKGYYQKR
ncbi:hypothetical protein [Clostridium sp.]|uniref:hypothetical protein n=1 Tax=Clostridium sp. TaxID=1506 RepID=UPI003F2F159E